ncbi:HD domain-containing protein [Desulfitibacter alkalitolerans]|uniref:HD domain-containing protein n=1 Tax=Desulfitibacter alkalitolerans TaxID=264641 RepID=UPI00047F9CAB|nr:HD domain-containing protein [Desulfitibacter alkalitolerans]
MSEKIKAILKHEEFIKRNKEIDTCEKDREFCLHNLQHFLDTSRITYILVLENNQYKKIFPGKDAGEVKELVYAAGLLHDLGRVEQYTDGTDHALVSGRIAKDIMEDVGFSPEDIKVVCQAIGEHRKYKKTNSPFGRKLYEGDKLSRQCQGCKAFDDCKIELEYKQGKQIY